MALAAILNTRKLPVQPGSGDSAVLVVYDGQGSAVGFDDVDLLPTHLKLSAPSEQAEDVSRARQPADHDHFWANC